MKRKSLDKALFKKENNVLNKFKTFGNFVRNPWGYIAYILGIFLIGVVICTPLSCCRKYYKKYNSYVNSYVDTINKTYPATKILEYTITGTISSNIHNYNVWVKGKNGNIYNITIPKNKCTVHMTNDSIGKCIVILHKYKGLLAYYDGHKHEEGSKENGTYSSWRHRKSNEFGLRDDKPAEVQYNYFNGYEIWYKFDAPKLVKYWKEEQVWTSSYRPTYGVRYFNSQTHIYVNQIL